MCGMQIDPDRVNELVQLGFTPDFAAGFSAAELLAAEQRCADPEAELLELCPKLKTSPYRIRGHITDRYNCIAWAAGDRTRWWWPNAAPRAYWPPGVPGNTTLDAFIGAFASIGFKTCDRPSSGLFFENIAIYVKNSEVQHAARQRINGRWSSKLGKFLLVDHDLDAVSGYDKGEYGDIAQFMRRIRRPVRAILEAMHEFASHRVDR